MPAAIGVYLLKFLRLLAARWRGRKPASSPEDAALLAAFTEIEPDLKRGRERLASCKHDGAAELAQLLPPASQTMLVDLLAAAIFNAWIGLTETPGVAAQLPYQASLALHGVLTVWAVAGVDRSLRREELPLPDTYEVLWPALAEEISRRWRGYGLDEARITQATALADEALRQLRPHPDTASLTTKDAAKSLVKDGLLFIALDPEHNDALVTALESAWRVLDVAGIGLLYRALGQSVDAPLATPAATA